MKRCSPILLTLLMAVALIPIAILSNAETQALAAPETSRFIAYDVIIDSGDAGLAAYQLEFDGGAGTLLVGIEGGGHNAFSEPPAYDPAALRGERAIIAAFNTGNDLPTGATRVATLHLMVRGDTDRTPTITLHAAADRAGVELDAGASVMQHKGTD